MEVVGVVAEFPRNDLRGCHESRPLSAELDVSSESEGSVKINFGKTCLLALVSGPSQPRYLRHEEFDKATLDIDFRYGSKSSNLDLRMQFERKIQEILSNIFLSVIDLKQYPRKLILLKLSVIRDDGNLLAASIIAGTFALLESGVQLFHLPIPVTCAALAIQSQERNQEQDTHLNHPQMLLDPNQEEESVAQSLHTFVFHVREGTAESSSEATPESCSLVATHSIGSFSPGILLSTLALCKETSLHVKDSMRTSLKASRHQKSRNPVEAEE
jgi:ribonuclease PH